MQVQDAKALLELIVEYGNEKNAMDLRSAYGSDNGDNSLDDIAERFARLLTNS